MVMEIGTEKASGPLPAMNQLRLKTVWSWIAFAGSWLMPMRRNRQDEGAEHGEPGGDVGEALGLHAEER